MTREAELLDLARAGVALTVIAERLGRDDVDGMRDELAVTLRASTGLPSDDLATLLEWDRLDRLHVAVWPNAMKGDAASVEQALRIGDRRRIIAAALAGRGGVSTGPSVPARRT